MKALVSRPSFRLALLAVVILIALVGGIVLADQPFPSTEPIPAADSAPASGEVLGASVGEGSSGLAPDENRPRDAAVAAPVAFFSYYMVSGATMRGRSSATSYTYDTNGCVQVTGLGGDSGVLNTELNIPDGSVIKYVRLYYGDTNATGSVRGSLARYRPGADAVDLVFAASTSSYAGGYSSDLSDQITHTVNNDSWAYTLKAWPSTVSNQLKICGMRVAYYPPTVAAAFLPIASKEATTE